MRPPIAIFAAAVLLIAGCGSGTPLKPASPSLKTSAAGFTMPTKLFSSPELGISLHYPATWMETTVGSFKTQGIAALTFRSPRVRATRARVAVMVSSGRVLSGKSPLPYIDAGANDLRLARQDQVGSRERILHAGFMQLDGLRLTEVEYVDTVPTPLSKVRSRTIELRSGSGMFGAGPDGSQVKIGLVAPLRDWHTEKATLLAILESMRFSTPQLLQ
jgi:hypothetical protein